MKNRDKKLSKLEHRLLHRIQIKFYMLHNCTTFAITKEQ